MKILNFEEVMKQVESGKVVEMMAYENFHCDGDYDLLYCKQGHLYFFKMENGFYSILKPFEDNSGHEDAVVVVVFKQERYQNSERADLKQYIENHFCKPLQDDVFVEIKKTVKNLDAVDYINQGLRKLHMEHDFFISDRSSFYLQDGHQEVRIVGQIKASKLSTICEIFSEVTKVNGQIRKTGYAICLDVDIAEYDFYVNRI